MAYFEKHFSLNEAQALLPVVRESFARIAKLRRKLFGAPDTGDYSTESTADMSPGAADAAEAALQINQIVLSLTELGVQVKDLSIGLVDFPHIRDGREVFLCYRLGEETVEFWHDLEAGFVGRQRL